MAHNTRNSARRDRKRSSKTEVSSSIARSARATIDEIVRALRPKTRCYHCGRRTTMNSYFDAYLGRVYPPICYNCYLDDSLDDEAIEATSCSLGECSDELLQAALDNVFIDPYFDDSQIVWN